MLGIWLLLVCQIVICISYQEFNLFFLGHLKFRWVIGGLDTDTSSGSGKTSRLFECLQGFLHIAHQWSFFVRSGNRIWNFLGHSDTVSFLTNCTNTYWRVQHALKARALNFHFEVWLVNHNVCVLYYIILYFSCWFIRPME